MFLQSSALGAAAAIAPLGKLFAADDVASGAPPSSLIIRGRMFTGGKVVDSGVRIENGSIVAVSARDLGRADQLIKLDSRQLLLPGAVDTHCALPDWSDAFGDDVEVESQAAVAGGVTVVCDMPNTTPRINSAELVRRRLDFVAERSYADYGISAHVPVDFERTVEYPEAGAFAVSFFPWDLRPWTFGGNEIAGNIRRCAQLGLAALVLAEEQGLLGTPLADEAERYAVGALLGGLEPDCKLRIVTSLPGSVETILAARKRLPNTLIEVAPHALLMSRETGYARIGAAAAHQPPLRSAADAARMLEFAERGSIDIFVSSHAAHGTPGKYTTRPIAGQVMPQAGYSAVDFAYPLYLSRLGIPQTCRCYCENPAKLLGLRKGLIAPGYDADLTIMEQAQGTIDPASFHSRGKVTPFVGEPLNYRVLKTFLRGTEVYDAVNGTFRRAPVRSVRAQGSAQA